MAKKRRSRSRSTSPHTNAPTQHATAGIMQCMSKVVANAATTAVRQLMSSGSKAMRRNKNQGPDATVQQGDASTTANVQGANASNNSNSGVNATQLKSMGLWIQMHRCYRIWSHELLIL